MKRAPLLFLNVFVIATCGLIYELLAGTLSSYVLGDSVTQFSLIIGIYLFAMGVGSWLSRFIEKNVAEKFVDIELAVALVGGFSAPLLFLTFAYVSYFGVVLYSRRCTNGMHSRATPLNPVSAWRQEPPFFRRPKWCSGGMRGEFRVQCMPICSSKSGPKLRARCTKADKVFLEFKSAN